MHQVSRTTATRRDPNAARTVLVADNQPIARHGLRRLLEQSPVRFQVAEAADGPTALQQVRALAPDLVILDLQLRTTRGTGALCHAIGHASPATRIVICATVDDPDPISECLAHGARGCILKDAEMSDIEAALARVEAGETVIAPRVAERLALRFTRVLSGEDCRLTKRERAVLTLLGDGLSNREIAGRLFLSEHTVKGHVTSVLHKLGARSRLEAVVLATRDGLLARHPGQGTFA